MNCRINKLTTAILIATGSTIFSNSVLAETFYLSSNTNETQANHYSDLRAVLDRAQEGDTIELLSDFNAPVRGDNNSYLFNFNKKVTIDGKGHKLSFPGANISLDKDVVFKNLSLHINPETSLNNTFTNLGSGTAEAQDAFIFMNGNKLTLDNVKTKQQGDNGFETKLNIVIGAKQGGTNAGNGELTTVNSNPATTVINSITVGSPNDDSTAPVNISLDNVGIKQVNFNNGTTEGSSYTGDINLTLTNKSNAHLINFTSEPENLNLILENTEVLSGDLKLSKVKNLDLKGTSALTIKKSLTVTEKLKVEENANISIGDDFDSDVEASLTATNIDPVSSGTIKLADGSSITAAGKNYSNAETYTLRNGEPTTEKRPSANTNVDDIEDEEDDTENTADTEENPNNSTTPPPEVTPENNSSEQPEVQPGSQASGNTDNSSTDNSATSENTIETQPETPTDSTTDEASNTTSVENQPNSNTSGETKPDSTTESTTSPTEDNSAETSELPKTTEQPGSQVSGNTDNSSTDNSATSENPTETQPETPTNSTTDGEQPESTVPNRPIRPSISVAQSTIGISNQILLDHLQSLNRAVIFQNLSFTDTDNLWVVVENSNAKQYSTTNYKMNNKAVTLGYKRQKENLQLGISATYDNARFRNNTSGQLIAKTFQTFMYGNYHSGNYISHFYLGGGLNLLESQQKIAEQTVKAHYRGKILQTGIALSYPINLTSATTLTPHIQANYAWLHTSTYNMSNISIPSQNTSSLRLGTGMRAQISLTEHLSFNALGNVSIETLNQKNKMQGTQWQLSQARPITTNLGAGLTYYFTPKASIEANYQNETRKGYTSHKGNVELSIKF